MIGISQSLLKRAFGRVQRATLIPFLFHSAANLVMGERLTLRLYREVPEARFREIANDIVSKVGGSIVWDAAASIAECRFPNFFFR